MTWHECVDLHYSITPILINYLMTQILTLTGLLLSQMENEKVIKCLNGVLNIGDELVSIERRLGSKLSLEDIKTMVAKRSSLRMRVRPPFRTIETEV